MKRIFIVLFLLFVATTVSADFITASTNYNNKQYAEAMEQYRELAMLGNKRAQYNLAVMYIHGEGTKSDLTEAYAWASLAQNNEHPEYAKALTIVSKKLSAEQLTTANARKAELEALYGDDNIYTTLAPIAYSSLDPDNTVEQDYQIELIKQTNPVYPKKLAVKGVQGWSTAQFDVSPDGTVHNLRILESIPQGAFENATINALKRWKFKITYQPGIQAHTIAATQTISYQISTNSDSAFEKKFSRRAEAIKELAEQENPNAQYLYAVTASASGMLNINSQLKASEANEWLLKAAQNGNVDAQYMLGKNILYGKGCKSEKQKGLFWVSIAAKNGNALGARMTYELLKSEDYINKTGKTAKQWLTQSALAGDPDSRLEWARLVASEENPTTEDLATARKYLKQSRSTRRKDADWYHVSAEIYRHEGNLKKSSSEEKKSKKLRT